MTRTTLPSRTRVVGRRVTQIALAGAVAATPLLFSGATASATDWDAVAQCESGGNWSTNTGNGFGGGLQFTPSTWRAYGGSGSADSASRDEQIQVAERVKAAQGMGAWPTCSRKTGQTSNSASTSSSTPSSTSSASKPSASKPSASTSSSTTSSSSKSSSSSGGTYTVAAGDTLSAIASSHGVSAGAAGLARRNGIADPDLIMPGQQLALG